MWVRVAEQIGDSGEEAQASLWQEGVDTGASSNRSSLLETCASSGRGQTGALWTDQGVDQRGAPKEKLAWIRPEALDLWFLLPL